MCRFVFKTSVRSWSTGAWMIFTWSLAVNTATTEPGGCCHNLILRKGRKLKEKKIKFAIQEEKKDNFGTGFCAPTQRHLWNLFENPHHSMAAKGSFYVF